MALAPAAAFDLQGHRGARGLMPDDTADVTRFVDAVLAVVREARMERRVTIQSFDWRSLRRAQQREPSIATAHPTTESPRFCNVRVVPWTANEPSGMQRLIGRGADVIIPGYPVRLRTAMQRAGLPLPPPLPP